MTVENYQKYLNPETLAKLQGLELRARLIVEGYVSGVHRSPFHGFSIELDALVQVFNYDAGHRIPSSSV